MRCLRLLPFLSLTAAVALAASAGCSSLKNADPTDPGGDGGEGGGADGPIGPEDDAGTKDGEADVDAGPAPDVCTQTTCKVDEILKNLYGPVSIAVNASHLYWIEVGALPTHPGYGELARISKSFTCKTQSCFDVLDDFVLSGQLQGQNIYEAHVGLGLNDVCYTQSFNTNSQHSVRCFALKDLVKRPLDDGAGALIDLWIGATEARWVLQSTTGTSSDGSIVRRALTGGTTTPLAVGRNNPVGVASDGTKTYWTELGAASPQGTVNTVLADGGAAPLATGRANPTSIRLYGQYLYWIEATKKVVMRGRTDGTGAPEQIAVTDDNPIELAVDASGVYWISSGVGTVAGSLAHAPLTPGGAITIMMKEINNVYSVTADTTDVYVASVGQMIADGRIDRIKKTR